MLAPCCWIFICKMTTSLGIAEHQQPILLMGCCSLFICCICCIYLQEIQHNRARLLDPFGTAYIVPGFTAEALLALAFWSGAAQKDFTGYWAERFHAAVPEELVQLLMPGLAALEASIAAARADGKPSALADNLARLLRMFAVVAVQDAHELADRYPGNPVHKMLLENARFK
jgi:hypothetical protein